MATPEEMAQTMIANMPEKTGKALSDWLALTVPSEHEKHGQLLKWLKSDHGVSHGFASLIAHETLKSRTGSAGTEAEVDLVAAQYSKGKEALRPVYDALVAAIGRFAVNAELAPKKAYVSLRNKKQFGLIQPSTKTRVDVGINLKGREPTSRLEASGSFNAMVSHRVRLSSVDEVDDELISWLREAYEQAG